MDTWTTFIFAFSAFRGLGQPIFFMSLLTQLITGAGVSTTVAGQSQCEEYILIGDVDTANPLQSITVEIDGTPFLNIQNAQTLISAYMKWMQGSTAGAVGFLLKIATGVIKRNTTYRFTNTGATIPNIYAFSDSQNGIPIVASTKSINVSSYEDFEKFSALFLQTPANLASAEIVFADGHKATMSFVELDALFSFKNQTDANGQLGGVTVIDNRDRSIKSVRLFAQTGSLVVLIAKIPDEAFKVLTANN